MIYAESSYFQRNKKLILYYERTVSLGVQADLCFLTWSTCIFWYTLQNHNHGTTAWLSRTVAV